MEIAYDGRQVVGVDLHRRRSVLVRMTEDGRRLGTARITNSPQELRAQIARAGKSPRVVLVRARSLRPLEPPEAYKTVPRRVRGLDGQIRGP